MFKESIRHNSFSTDIADTVFSHVSGENYGSDVSLVTTLRALIAPRMKEGDSIRVSFSSSYVTKSEIDEINDNGAVIRRVCDPIPVRDEHVVHVHDLRSRDHDDNNAVLEILKDGFCGAFEGYSMLQKPTQFFKQSFGVACFANESLKSVIVFIDRLDVRKLHYFQCSVFALFPWFFSHGDKVDEDELALVYSMREKTPDKYNEAIEKIAAKYDFETQRIKSLLAGFETKYKELEIRNLNQTIESLNRELDSYQRRFSDALRKIDECNTKLYGLKYVIDSNDSTSEIMEYFLGNNKLHLVSVGDSTMDFIAKDYIMFFDEDNARNVIDNPSSFVYDNRGSISRADIKKLMTSIFVDQDIKIKVCAAYSFDLSGEVNAISHYGFDDSMADYMPNPHIQEYACLGNYQVEINKFLRKCDYVMAIEQCLASVRSLNFGDGSVMEKFMRYLNGGRYKGKCFELPDGTCTDIDGAVAWVNREQSNGDSE